ncbi:MAG: glycosyltransferase family 2 protein, partial [Pedobacter sp.]
MPKSVAIILLNWNTPEHTINCILSVNKFCKAEDFDIIVADNGSTDDSLSILKTKFPTLTILDNKVNLGFSEGNNKVLEYSLKKGYTYSLVLNNDTEVTPELLD